MNQQTMNFESRNMPLLPPELAFQLQRLLKGVQYLRQPLHQPHSTIHYSLLALHCPRYP